MKLTIANTEIHQDAEGRYSLNDLHRASGGEDKNKPSNFLRSEQTQKLIEAINRCSDSSSGSSNPMNALSTKEGGRNQGSYGVKELVYAYANWISADFYLQMIRTFDAVATGDTEKAARIARPRADSTALDKLRTANALKLAEETAAKLCARFSRLGESAQQVIYAKIINPIVGDEVLMLPHVEEKLKKAGEVGDLLGVSGNKIGRLSNQHNMKSPEFGEFRLDKSEHSSKQVEAFHYNAKAVEMFRMILAEDVPEKVVPISGGLSHAG